MQKLSSYHVPLEFWELNQTYFTGDITGRNRKKPIEAAKKDFEIIPGVTVGLYYREKLKKADFNKFLL